MVIIDEMPFISVEGEGFKRYSKVLQPRFEIPSRITVERDCMQHHIDFVELDTKPFDASVRVVLVMLVQRQQQFCLCFG
ncbi:hypothetical protein GQ55_2G468500 [Panicum hallii var. hallii]|uniref:Uncharacterized protein n=1 Tax=Panicum hallii var. hallii TaxID=1504633 RepID=A0A2T7EZW1_9POAL|nr:hypothetical protein GQ55_2G468500 [Panicum hallii var. hallii]